MPGSPYLSQYVEVRFSNYEKEAMTTPYNLAANIRSQAFQIVLLLVPLLGTLSF